MNPGARLGEIKDQIKELMDEAESLVRRHGTSIVKERAKSYWVPHILMALDNDHEYLGGDAFTMESAANALDNGEDDEEEECDEDHEGIDEDSAEAS